MEAAIKVLREGQNLSGQGGILTPLLKQLSEAAMPAELENHLLSEDPSNRKHGRTPKAMQRSADEFEINIQRDRAVRFEELRRDRHSVLAGKFQSVCPCELPVNFCGDSKLSIRRTELLGR